MNRVGRDSRKLLDNEQTVMPLCWSPSPPLPHISLWLPVCHPDLPLSPIPQGPFLSPLLPLLVCCYPYYYPLTVTHTRLYPLSISQTTLSVTPTALSPLFVTRLFPPKQHHTLSYSLYLGLYSLPLSLHLSIRLPSLPVSVPAH